MIVILFIIIDTASPRQTPSRQNSQDSVEDDNEDIMYEDGTRSRNPVRRSNSSPEMSAGNVRNVY